MKKTIGLNVALDNIDCTIGILRNAVNETRIKYEITRLLLVSRKNPTMHHAYLHILTVQP